MESFSEYMTSSPQVAEEGNPRIPKNFTQSQAINGGMGVSPRRAISSLYSYIISVFTHHNNVLSSLLDASMPGASISTILLHAST